MERVASIFRNKQHKVKDYIAYHADVWPDVLEMISACNIHIRDGLCSTLKPVWQVTMNLISQN